MAFVSRGAKAGGEGRPARVRVRRSRLAWERSSAPPPPALEHVVDLVAHALPRVCAFHAAHEEVVGVGVAVADRRDHRQLDGRPVDGATGGAPSDAAAAA